MQPEITYYNKKDEKIKEIAYHPNGQKYYEAYIVNGECHRTDGPAFTQWYMNGQKEYETYYVNGLQILPEWFEDLGYNIENDFSDPEILGMILMHHG